MRWVIYPLFICILFFCSGCSWFEDNRVRVIYPKVDTTSQKYREMVSTLIGNRYKTEMMIKYIEAELAYQKYLLEIENEKKDFHNR